MTSNETIDPCSAPLADASRAALAALEAQVRKDIPRVQARPEPWLPKSTMDPTYSVVICGAGLSGLGLAFGLLRRGINDFLILDENPAGREGPWITTARMKTLRSPKYLAALDFGIPSLTLQSWFEATYSEEAWEALDKPSKEDWMSYLKWFRRITGIKVQNNTKLEHVAPILDDEGLQLTLSDAAGTQSVVTASQLVLATGLDGGGGPRIPKEVRDSLPPDRYTHSGHTYDDHMLAGRSIAVLGGATSSFDWSVTALELGAREVRQFARTPGLSRTEALAWMDFPGFMGHFPDLPADLRWRFMHRYFQFKIPPTQDQYDRAMRDPKFMMVEGTGTNRFSVEKDGRIRIENDCGTFHADHLLLGTGYELNAEIRPELRALAGRFQTWGEAYTPPQGQEDPYIAAHPYLGSGFELTPKTPQDAWVSRVHMYNAAAVPSLGPVSNGVTGFKYGAPRLVAALVGRLFEENVEHFFHDLDQFDAQHFTPREPS